MQVIIGKKVGMTQLFSESGVLVPVTAIEVEPNLIVDLKTPEKDGYSAVVAGYGEIKEKELSKPVLGQFKKKKLTPRRKIIEFRNMDQKGLEVGGTLNIEALFKAGDLVDVSGITRGHGFTGAIKLWNFACGPRSHGAGYPHRYQGSLETGRGGMSPQKVWKGKKMAGRYGVEKVTIANLEVVYIDADKKLIFLKGAVPGRSNSLLRIKTTTRKRKHKAEAFKLLKHERS
ncbi:50S ribosomal protein L3 [Candidatus Mycoplasma haematobovis]|uniref:Large ribosomal subunit protein uL3 n=1 Tax=Candidatus Mycoplasma haematobovis TaxID=432608 RepID=A0A1A9QE18_9MOLU|nr:50S ribosomal protein L3 [Candidatus Mycoplasma haematobovis]OAL10364.1 50S ribosomal protein L3 [Candidatus Mycoplasma haematobovis]